MKISDTINQYAFSNDNSKYTIFNYDYFTTDYRIPNNSELSELPEYSNIRSIISKLDKNKIIIDIGANCGLLSIPCTLDGYTVFAFEPISLNVQLLEKSKLENNCDTLTIIQAALMDSICEQTIYVPYCSDNTSFNKDVAISNMASKDYIEERVNCITFDSWFLKNKCDIGFIKIDVQGFEQNVLVGMKNFLNSCHHVYIFLEWDPTHTTSAGNDLNEISEILSTAGFNEVATYTTDKLFYKE
jgi:FkbM family methyltransferase